VPRNSDQKADAHRATAFFLLLDKKETLANHRGGGLAPLSSRSYLNGMQPE